MRSLFHLANYAPERKNSLGRLCSYPHETARSQFDELTKNDIDDVIKMFRELQEKIER